MKCSGNGVDSVKPWFCSTPRMRMLRLSASMAMIQLLMLASLSTERMSGPQSSNMTR